MECEINEIKGLGGQSNAPANLSPGKKTSNRCK